MTPASVPSTPGSALGVLSPSGRGRSAAAARRIMLPAWASEPYLRFKHMTDALSTAFRSANLTLLAALPHQQQLLLCTMVP